MVRALNSQKGLKSCPLRCSIGKPRHRMARDCLLASMAEGSEFENINKKRHSEGASESSFTVPSTCRVLEAPPPAKAACPPMGTPVFQKGLSSIASIKSSGIHATGWFSAQLVLQQHFQPLAKLAELLALEGALGPLQRGYGIMQRLFQLARHCGRALAIGAAVLRLPHQIVKIR